ncbi:hypothetical protein D3C77_587880 [compost metagenome]
MLLIEDRIRDKNDQTPGDSCVRLGNKRPSLFKCFLAGRRLQYFSSKIKRLRRCRQYFAGGIGYGHGVEGSRLHFQAIRFPQQSCLVIHDQSDFRSAHTQSLQCRLKEAFRCLRQLLRVHPIRFQRAGEQRLFICIVPA